MTTPLPLAGLRVLEMGAVIAAPFCASLLAELGAEVVKIERPDGGDPFRGMGPSVDGVPLWWGVASRNKRCITMDLKSTRDRRRFEVLVTGADVFIENNRPGALERLGLGWPALSAINPRLIMLSISGFGQTGPDAQRPGFGKVAEAMSGQVVLTGPPDRTPFHVGFSLADATAGLFGLFGIAVALFLQRRAGREAGTHIDLALYEPLLRMTECQFALHDRLGRSPRRGGGNNPYGWGLPGEDVPDVAMMQAADGAWIAALPGEDAPDRLRGEAGGAVAALVSGLPCAAALDALAASGIEAVRVHDGESMAADPYLRARGDVLPVRHGGFDALCAPGFVPHGYDAARLHAFRTPEVGEADAEVLGGLPEGASPGGGT